MRLGLAASPTGLDNLKVCRFVLIFNIFGEKNGYWKDPKKKFFFGTPLFGNAPIFAGLNIACHLEEVRSSCNTDI